MAQGCQTLRSISDPVYPLYHLNIDMQYHCITVIIIIITRLPSNPTPTTHYSMHLVRRGHFRSCDKDGGHHLIRHSQEPNDICKPHGSIFYRTGVMGNRNFTMREWRLFRPFCSCDFDLDPMIFVCEPDLYSQEIHRMCKYELPTSRL